MKIIKQNVGVDIAKDSFVSTFTILTENQDVKFLSTKTFKNNLKGIEKQMLWIEKLKDKNTKLSFTMEATGVYYENLAYYLFENKEQVHVILPNKAKKFSESLDLKSKTDKIDSKMLGQMGVERKLRMWKITSKRLRTIRTFTRERQQLVKESTIVKNRIHAENHKAFPEKKTLTRMNNRLKYISKQVASVEVDIKKEVSKDEVLKSKIKKIQTIPGLGFMSIITVIAETKGFAEITSIKQLSSYAGYDVQLRESGKWKGKSRISKKGNSNIRAIMYMPTISSITHNKVNKQFS
jgi:transposase